MIFPKNSRILIPFCLAMSFLNACRSERVIRENPLGDAREVSEVLTGYFIADRECVKGEGLKSFQALVGRKWNGRNLEIKPVTGVNFSASSSLSGGIIAETFINLHQFSTCSRPAGDPNGESFMGESCNPEAEVVAKPVRFPICQDSYLFPRQSYEGIAISSAISIDEAHQFYKSIETTELPKVSLIVLPVLEKRTLRSNGSEDRKFQMDNLAFVDAFIDKPAFVVYPTSPERQPGDNTNTLNLWESSWTLGHEFGHLVLASVSGVKKSSLLLDSSHVAIVQQKNEWSSSGTAPMRSARFSGDKSGMDYLKARSKQKNFLDNQTEKNQMGAAVLRGALTKESRPSDVNLASGSWFESERLLGTFYSDRTYSFNYGENLHDSKFTDSPPMLYLEEVRIVSNQDVWSAINEGFADLYATAMSGGSELTAGVPCISQSRNPDYGFFQTGEAKIMNDYTLSQFYSTQRLLPSSNCAAPFLQSPHTLGAIISYGLRGLSTTRGDSAAQFGKSLINWAKNLGEYVRKNPKLEFKDLVFEGVKAFGFMSNNIVYLNQNQCRHLIQSFPEFSKIWYQTGVLNCQAR